LATSPHPYGNPKVCEKQLGFAAQYMRGDRINDNTNNNFGKGSKGKGKGGGKGDGAVYLAGVATKVTQTLILTLTLTLTWTLNWKVNGKCGGIDHVVEMMSGGGAGYVPDSSARDVRVRGPWPKNVEPYMLIGADVTHSTGGGQCSIAAMVGTLDYNMTDYAHAERVQPPTGATKGGRGRNSMQGREIIKGAEMVRDMTHTTLIRPSHSH